MQIGSRAVPSTPNAKACVAIIKREGEEEREGKREKVWLKHLGESSVCGEAFLSHESDCRGWSGKRQNSQPLVSWESLLPFEESEREEGGCLKYLVGFFLLLFSGERSAG